MRWLKTEYVLKGVYLGLILYAAFQAAATPKNLLVGEVASGAAFQSQAAAASHTAGWYSLLWVNLAGLAGLLIAMGAAGFQKLREGYAVKGRLPAFLFFLLLESPLLIYAGLIGGTLAGVLCTMKADMGQVLIVMLGSGALVGVAFGALRQVPQKSVRLGLILLLSAALAAGVLALFGMSEFLLEGFQEFRNALIPADFDINRTVFGVQLLLGIPFFYVLTFAGNEEESEVEIGAMCATFAVAVPMLFGEQGSFGDDATYKAMGARVLGYFVPLIVYFWYTLRVLPWLRVMKHTFRGFSHARVGRFSRALQSFRRALQLDPNNQMARNGFWHVHCQLDFNEVRNDPQMMALVDLNLCMERAGSLLLPAVGKPTPAHLQESRRLLELVLTLNPGLRPCADYWEAIAHIHCREFDHAEVNLNHLLNPNHYGIDNAARNVVLLQGWQLALTNLDELRRRVGEPQLAQPGRRMDAIGAVERQLARQPDDQYTWGLKRLLYADLVEADYDAWVGAGKFAAHFDHAYTRDLGSALINDTGRWQRGVEFLRMAARGLPANATGIYVQIAKAHQTNGDDAGALHYFNLARRAGQAVGVKNLPEPEQQTYFATCKFLGDSAQYHGNVEEAIENYHLYAENERAGVETLRTLADLYEKKGDALNALRINDHALVYNPRDADLLARKDRYYYSVTPEQLRQHLEVFKAGFDVDYCVRKAQNILNGRYEDPEWLLVAGHLIQLARILVPENLAAKVLEARVCMRTGDRERALALLAEVRAAKDKAGSGEEQEAWYVANQLLGDLYLETARPDLAVQCLEAFRESSKSGAKTWYKMAQAYEQLGDRAKAMRCYEQVTAYEGNPLVYEARAAMSRMKAPV
jgi:tetratricopeptide (TPR) repeat protein